MMRRGLAGLMLAAALATAAAAQPAPGPSVDQPGKLPEDKPATVPDLAYDSRLLSSYASIQGFMGPLDGAWVVVGERPLYELQLSDRQGQVEGAWRRLDVKASGVTDSVQRTGNAVVFRFDGAVLTLKPGWTGELARDGRVQTVTLKKEAGPGGLR
jgi:hypothetical protein